MGAPRGRARARMPRRRPRSPSSSPQVAALKTTLKAELKAELAAELGAPAGVTPAHSVEPGPVRWVTEAFSFYRGQTALVDAAIRAFGGRKAALYDASLDDEGVEWDVAYTSKQRCTDLEAAVAPGQRASCIPRLQTLTWKDSLPEVLVAALGRERAFNITPPSFLIPEQEAEWHAWAAARPDEEGGGAAWVLKELTHGKTGVTILPYADAAASAGETGDDGEHRYRVVQRYLGKQMLAEALGGDCALRAWVLVTNLDPVRAYLFDGGIFESNTKHLTYWQSANEGVLGKAGAGKAASSDAATTALGADNEKPTPWALARLADFVGNATGSRTAFDQLWRDVASVTADAVAAGAEADHCNLPHSGWRCGERAFTPGSWELFGFDYMFDEAMKPWLLEVNASPAIKVRSYWSADYSAAAPDSPEAVLGREYDAEQGAVVKAYVDLLQATTVRGAHKRAGCSATACEPYTSGACAPGAGCETEAEMAARVGFQPLL